MNFGFSKMGKKSSQKQKRVAQVLGSTSSDLLEDSHMNQCHKPTAKALLTPFFSEAIGNYTIMPIYDIQEFDANFSVLPLLASHTFHYYTQYENSINCILAKEELVYYATGLLWIKLLDVKEKKGQKCLSDEEEDILFANRNMVYSIPEPLYTYISLITNKSVKIFEEAELRVPALPVATTEGFGGYHAVSIDLDTHNLFEEVPCLGIVGDVLMALSSTLPLTPEHFHVEIPQGAMLTRNLCGRLPSRNVVRPEIIRRLRSHGITPHEFPEYVKNTRFNLMYMQELSNIIGAFNTFRNFETNLTNLPVTSDKIMGIICKPMSTEDADDTWTSRTVEATSVCDMTSAEVGAAIVFGFQLYKEPGYSKTGDTRYCNWSCIAPAPVEKPWHMPEDWENSRNVRRNLPQHIQTVSFRSNKLHQHTKRKDVVWRMMNNFKQCT